MLKLMKYEFRKSRTMILVIAVVLAALECYFLWAVGGRNEDHTVISISLLMMAAGACYLFVLIYGIMSYSRELSSKSSYLIFMTPNSTGKIIASKLLTTLLVGIVICVCLGIFGTMDITMVYNTYSSLSSLSEMINEVLQMFRLDLNHMMVTAVVTVIEFLINFFSVIVLAYLAITLSATQFQNRKFKGLISCIIFVVLMVILQVVSDRLPTLEVEGTTILAMSYSRLPQFLWMLVVMIASAIGSAVLLDRKVSL